MKLLVAFDGSREAEEALAYATDIADATASPMTVAHAVEPRIYQEGGSEQVSGLSDADQRLYFESIEDAEERGLDVLDDASAFAADLGHDVETALLHGDPVETITDYAREEGFDTIFVGHRGRSRHADLLIGSVAKGIVERATVPVTVVR